MKNTAFITGATSGFGKEIAEILVKNGYKIIILGRRLEKLKAIQDEFGSELVHIINADIRDKERIFSEVEKLPENFQDIEILINNAGLALGQDLVHEASIEDFEVMIDTNIKGVLYATKAVLPIMIKRDSGYIFNLGSVAGKWPYLGANVYGGTKAFIEQFSLNLRNDLRGKKIRVTNLAPGIAKTEFSLVRFKGDAKKSDAVYEDTEFLTAQDIAQVIFNCINLPKRVNINSIELMPTSQSWAGFYFERM